MTAYKIRNWNEIYESHRSRPLKKLEWIRIPIAFTDDAYLELVDHEHGAHHWGIWVAIILVASACEPRGFLVRGQGQPHTAETLSRLTRLPVEMFAEALPRLVEIGWLESVTISDCNKTPDQRQNPAQIRRQSGDREEESREEENRSAAFISVARVSPTKPPESQNKTTASELLCRFPGAEGLPGEPDDEILGQCLLLASDSPERLAWALRKIFLAGKKPATSWAWFPVVLQQYL